MIYVMSDIHGQAGAFYKMLKKICFSDNDQMYVLGDVIDRGPDGIEIIKYVMSRKNITLLIGNHEHMMLDALRTGLSHDYDLWFYNGGMMTLDSFNELGSAEKDKMLEYLKNCPVVIPDVKVNNRKFYLTHAGWLNRKSILLYKDAFVFDIEDATWDRDFANCPHKEKGFEGYRIIFGHTPTPRLYYGRINKKDIPLISYCKKAIAIDCGMGTPKYGQLGCLRLDDLREFYIREELRI